MGIDGEHGPLLGSRGCRATVLVAMVKLLLCSDRRWRWWFSTEGAEKGVRRRRRAMGFVVAVVIWLLRRMGFG